MNLNVKFYYPKEIRRKSDTKLGVLKRWILVKRLGFVNTILLIVQTILKVSNDAKQRSAVND